MAFTTYILHSDSISKYYTGFTAMPVEERVQKHLTNHKGFTARAKDWNIVFTKSFDSKQEALDLEKSIKKRGAKRFLSE